MRYETLIDSLIPQNEGDPCANCGKRPGVIKWGDALAVTHGFARWWCELCAIEAQLEHCYERQACIPTLEKKREELIKQYAQEC